MSNLSEAKFLKKASMLDEKSLVRRCTKGDRKAQRELYDHFAPKMMVVALRYSKIEAEAEDILQESFMKVFNNLKSFRGESKLETWIHRITVNTALNYHRSKFHLFPMIDINDLSHENVEEDLVRGIHFKELLKMIQSLPTGSQAVFNLYAIEGYDHKSIAEMLGISVGTSKSQYSRARMLLKDMLMKNERIQYGNV